MRAASLITGARGKDLVVQKSLTNETSTPRSRVIGRFCLQLRRQYRRVVNVPEVKEYSKGFPMSSFPNDNLFTCSQDTQDKMKKLLEEHRINRVVVASCSPRTHEPLFRATIREKGLNKYLFEMANIRDQCSWVHMHDKEDATEKAKALVRMAVMNANHIKPLREATIDVNRKALVVGGGIGGMTAALKLADQGFEVFLIEKEEALGGNLRHIQPHPRWASIVQGFLKETIEKVTGHPLIHVEINAAVVDHGGFKGNFSTGIAVGASKEHKKIEHGVIHHCHRRQGAEASRAISATAKIKGS